MEIKSRFIELGFKVADHSTALLAYWDKDLVCRYANYAYVEWFGKSPLEMIDKITIQNLLGPLFEINYPYIKGVLEGRTQTFESNIITPNGEIKNVIATYSPDYENEQIMGFFAHVADITATKNQNKSTSANGGDLKHDKNSVLNNQDILFKISETLKANLLKGFPGLKELAKNHFISESKLKRDFKAKFNTTVFSYYRDLQMELADNYLTEKKCSKKQMTYLLNFSNQNNFSACYKKYLERKNNRKIISDLENWNEDLYKTFINKASFAVALLDPDLRYLAFSEKWVNCFKISKKELIGASFHADIPNDQLKWDELLSDGLQGGFHASKEDFVKLQDGTVLWLNWDIRPWLKPNNQIGGVLICMEDITALKLKDIENEKIMAILNKTNEIARIGAWTRDFDNGTIYWSKILKEILEVPEGHKPPGELEFNFYKEGQDREKVKAAFQNAISNGHPFDIEAYLVSMRGNVKNVRVIGYPEYRDGKCHKLSGIFQELAN
ncbi:MAG: helix-turn-helix protein [Mucilaginibacter sp.]|nr:helix-turn-helix protein [Mucilaginibacter sp.]